MPLEEIPDEKSRELHEITEQLSVENRLDSSEKGVLKDEKLFDLILENVSSGVALIDETGSFLLYNQTFLKLFGLSEESTIKNVNDQNWSEWQVFNEHNEILHVDDHPVRRAALTGKRVNNQLVGVRLPSGGDLIWMLISAEPIYNKNGELVKTICTYQDITHYKITSEAMLKSEQRYSQLFNSMTEMFEVIDTAERRN